MLAKWTANRLITELPHAALAFAGTARLACDNCELPYDSQVYQLHDIIQLSGHQPAQPRDGEPTIPVAKLKRDANHTVAEHGEPDRTNIHHQVKCEMFGLF